jgi:thiamine biosynthesis lipoprotein
MSSSSPEPVILARHAMATRFEMVLHGEDPIALRAAGEEALNEIERLENLLSLYRNTSEIAHLNSRAAREPIHVSPTVFRLLDQARCLSEETEGAFDITIAPLVRCWGFMGGARELPSPEIVAEARAKVGMNLVELNPATLTVRFACDGVMLDPGAIGKGYAIDQAAETIREAGVTSAILHGGTSSIYAIGHPPDAEHWKVAIERPGENAEASKQRVAIVPLRDEALSVSAVWGKSFQSGGRVLGHIIDPRSGEPAGRAVQAAVAVASATESDALSTALLVAGSDGMEWMGRIRPAARALVLATSDDGVKIYSRGIPTK